MQIGERKYDNLLAGSISPIVSKGATLKAGQQYFRGDVLALDADNKAVLIDSESEVDSVKEPYAILAEDVDATEEDAEAGVYLTGEFNAHALRTSENDEIYDHIIALRNIGIFVKENIEA